MRLTLAAMLTAFTISLAQGATPTPHLFLSQDGIALSVFPNRATLRHSITVSRTIGSTPISWAAKSDQPWLSVTPTGINNGSLTMVAAPTGLKFDTLLIANVTVTVTAGDFRDSETIRVGFWRGSVAQKTVTVQQSALSVATNPVEPIAYVTDEDENIYAYNVYSGVLTTTFKKVAPTVGSMAVSSDGRTVYATDTTNYAVVALDADSGAILSRYKLGYNPGNPFNIVYARPFGQDAIYVAGGPIIAYPSAQKIAAGLPAAYIAVTPDGTKPGWH